MIPRKKLSELKARFELEPTLDDVFVEGDQDKRILDRAHGYQKQHRPVYSSSSIDIPPELVVSLGLTDGNRQRVLALCQFLNLSSLSRVRCLVDADMDRHLGRVVHLPSLTYTVYTDIEGVFLSHDTVLELVINAGRSKTDDWPTLFASIECAVKGIYSVHLALNEMNINIKTPPFIGSVSKVGDRVIFDLEGFVGKLASKGINPQSLSNIKTRCTEWYEKIAGCEARNAGRGHDYLELLSWVIKKFGGSTDVAGGLDNILVLLVPEVVDELLTPLA